MIRKICLFCEGEDMGLDGFMHLRGCPVYDSNIKIEYGYHISDQGFFLMAVIIKGLLFLYPTTISEYLEGCSDDTLWEIHGHKAIEQSIEDYNAGKGTPLELCALGRNYLQLINKNAKNRKQVKTA
jgi:hypothetical protein